MQGLAQSENSSATTAGTTSITTTTTTTTTTTGWPLGGGTLLCLPYSAFVEGVMRLVVVVVIMVMDTRQAYVTM